MTLTLGRGSKKKHKGPQRECWEGRQWRLKRKWGKSYWKMEDRGHLLGSGGKLDSTVTWSNIEIGNEPDKFSEIAKVILLPVIKVQNERISLKQTYKQHNVKHKKAQDFQSSQIKLLLIHSLSIRQTTLMWERVKSRMGKKISCYNVRMILNLCSIDPFRPKGPIRISRANLLSFKQ